MRRTDMLLAILVVALAVGLILGPPLYREWQESTQAKTEPVLAPAVAEVERDPATGAGPKIALAEVERVSGMLMLYKACANRFDGFDTKARPVFESWKQQNAETLAKRGAELDFHIVLADPAGIERNETEPGHEEERALCERNLDAMRADLEKPAVDNVPRE